MVSSSERLTLIQMLSSLPEAQFKQVVFALDPPKGILPTEASQGKMASVLLDWVESPTGPGMNAFKEILNQGIGVKSLSQTTICPYKGLSYFDFNNEDYKYFYGRDALTQTMLERVAKGNFLAIVGASGSGKSSVLRAGLLQHLQDKGGCEIRILVPGEHPLQNLALAFVNEGLNRIERAKQQREAEVLLQDGSEGLRCLIQASDARRVVLIVDQFEEAFTLCQDIRERQAFFETLLGGLEATPSTLCLVLSMRSDFVGKCLEHDYGGLADKVQENLLSIRPMTPEELTQAIVEPARRIGVSLEPGLTQALLKDVALSPGGLPLLQYTLTELWKRQQGNQLKLSVYHQLGGVTGTLRQRADEVYDSLTLEQQQIAKHIFLSLTHLGEGAEDTRRRITQDSLVSTQHSKNQVVEVVKRLADANLVVTDKWGKILDGKRIAIIDVAHEALIRNWPKLRQWLDENRDLLRQQRRIEQAAEEWYEQSHRQQKDYLLQGPQLYNAQTFMKRYGESFPLSQRAEFYLAKSLAYRRQKRVKIITASITVPVALAIYAGIYVSTYLKLRPAWKIVFSYSATSNRVENDLLVQAVEAINNENRSLNRVSLPTANLSNVYLSNAELRRAILSKANLQRADLSGTSLRGANLFEADLSDAYLRDADLGGADLRGAHLSAVNLSDAFLRGADLDNVFLHEGAIFHNADLRNATLRKAKLPNTNFSGSDLSNADLSGADLSGSNLSGTIIRYTNFRNANLHNVDFRNTQLCFTQLPDEIPLDPNRDCSEDDLNPKIELEPPLPPMSNNALNVRIKGSAGRM